MSRRSQGAKPLLARLERLDSGAVSDALDVLGLSGAVAGIVPLSGPGRIVGTAVTVRLGPPRRGPSRHLCTAAIEAAAPGDVIVVEHGGREDAAGWGGLLSAAASARGLTGSVVDGAVRDLDQSRRIGYAVFARSAVPFTARGRASEVGWNRPVRVAGVRVHPGALVIADASGVAFVPEARAEEVLRLAERIAAREESMEKAIRGGTPVSRVMDSDYEAMLLHGRRRRR